MSDFLKNRDIQHDGKTVGFNVIKEGEKFIAARQRLGHSDMCPLCKQLFRTSVVTSIVLIISNQVGIPNRFVHSYCLVAITDECAFRMIVEDYEESKKYADWYPNGRIQ